MPKKSTRSARSAQQRAREEQWRRRIAAQARQQIAEAVEDLHTIDSIGGEAAPEVASTPPGAHSRSAARSHTNGVGGRSAQTAPSTQGRYGTAVTTRRGGTPSPASASGRSARARMAATTLSLEEEMYYVRTDIRRLVLLTVICIAVLVVLSFILR